MRDEYNIYINGVIGGEWFCWWNEDTGIMTAVDILISDNYQDYENYTTYKSLVLEELLQGMACGWDQYEIAQDTLYCDIPYYNAPTHLTERDKGILKLAYSSQVNYGDPYYKVCDTLNLARGCYLVGTDESNREMTIDASEFLTEGNVYRIRAFVVNSSGYVSATSGWLTIEFGDTGICWIYDGGWKRAIPYIYTGTGWTKAVPYIYNSGWKSCK